MAPPIDPATPSFRSRSENPSASVSACHSPRRTSAIRATCSTARIRLAGRTGIIPGNSAESFATVSISDDVKEDSLHGRGARDKVYNDNHASPECHLTHPFPVSGSWGLRLQSHVL